MSAIQTAARPRRALPQLMTLSDAAATRLQATWPAFKRDTFTCLANQDLDALEMKARAMQIASALEATLPADFGAACDVIEQALAPALDPGEAPAPDEPGLRGWTPPPAFAKRTSQSGASRDAIRAHSSVGRAADS